MRERLSKLLKRGEDFFCEAWKTASKPFGLAGKNCGKPFCPAGLFALAKRVFENYDMWRCSEFLGLARRATAALPASGNARERNAAKPKKLAQPSGDGSFGRLRRWLGSQSPLRGFSCLAASDSAKIAHRATHRSFQTLSKLPCGYCVTVKALEIAHDKAEELRRIGIREGARISLLRNDETLLVSVENSRVAIGGKLAKHIKVTR